MDQLFRRQQDEEDAASDPGSAIIRQHCQAYLEWFLRRYFPEVVPANGIFNPTPVSAGLIRGKTPSQPPQPGCSTGCKDSRKKPRKEKPASCKICGKILSSMANMKRHMKHVHGVDIDKLKKK